VASRYLVASREKTTETTTDRDDAREFVLLPHLLLRKYTSWSLVDDDVESYLTNDSEEKRRGGENLSRVDEAPRVKWPLPLWRGGEERSEAKSLSRTKEKA